jgi:hypothetical protein
MIRKHWLDVMSVLFILAFIVTVIWLEKGSWW